MMKRPPMMPPAAPAQPKPKKPTKKKPVIQKKYSAGKKPKK